MQAAGVGCEVFGGCAGVFSAIQGAQRVNFTYSFAFGVESQPGADVWQLAAGAAAKASASTGLIDGQKAGYGPFELGGPGVFGGLFCFNNSHN